MSKNLIKTQLAVEIYKIFISKRITQTEFGKVLGIKQAKVSRLCMGHLREFSLETLIDYLQCLGRYVVIEIKEGE
jgi:predicted XRE-type DNA-binding protein